MSRPTTAAALAGVAGVAALLVARAGRSPPPPLAGRKVLVVGASGAIGRVLVARLLRAGVRVVACLHRSPLRLQPPGLADSPLLTQAFGVDVLRADTLARVFAAHAGGVAAVWMLAAPLSVESARDPARAENIVVGGMDRLLYLATRYRVPRVLFSDSIGSYGAAAPRTGCTARWLTEHPWQDPGSDYGRQKRACRNLMRVWAASKPGAREARWAVIPGVLHTDPAWGDGTTEYALAAVRAAARGEAFACPVPLDVRLPMCMRDDVVEALFRLTTAARAGLREPEGGYAISGLSFSARELFASIRRTVAPGFTWTAMTDAEERASPAATFARLWPDALCPAAARRDLGFAARGGTLDEVVRTLFAAWEGRGRET